MRVHGAPCGASRVMPNDVPVAAIHEEVDAAAGRTIVVRDPWDPLGNDGLHCAFGRLTSTAGSAKGREDVEVHEGLDGQRQVVRQRVRLVDGLPGGRGQVELRTVPAQRLLVLLQGLGQEDAPLPRTTARRRSTDD